jgi:ABC-2 type transport system ATP-binding protein
MIEVSHLTRRFDTILAVDDIAFNVNEGEIVGFLGPNGAGKTTTLRMLVGYLQPSSGNITIGDRDINSDPLSIARMIGYLPEHNPLYDDMTVYDYLQFIAEIRHLKKDVFEDRLEYVIAKCGLREVIGQQIQTISKGYRQRTGLAQAILHDPSVLILDEPTSGLDPNQIMEIRELIRDLGKAKTVILSSHIMQEVQAMCDRIIIINKGKIVADELKEDLGKFIKQQTILSVEIEADNPDFSEWLALNPEAALEITSVAGIQFKLQITYPSNLDLQRDLAQYITANGWLILSMYKQIHSLEEIFHTLTTGDFDVYEKDAPEESNTDLQSVEYEDLLSPTQSPADDNIPDALKQNQQPALNESTDKENTDA